MTPLVVVAPSDVAAGFALGGARSVVAETGPDAVRRVGEALTEGAAVVVVHAELWTRIPPPVRRRWEQEGNHLVLGLPPDDGVPTEQRGAELHELLAGAVGYEISFTTGGDT